MKAIDKLSDSHVLALYQFVSKAGKFWRAKLVGCFESGNYSRYVADGAALQQMRNKHGTGLITCCLKTADIIEAARAIGEARQPIDSRTHYSEVTKLDEELRRMYPDTPATEPTRS